MRQRARAAEPEADQHDPVDEVVDRLGGPVADEGGPEAVGATASRRVRREAHASDPAVAPNRSPSEPRPSSAGTPCLLVPVSALPRGLCESERTQRSERE
jgi:hypothetical protein